MKATAQQLAHAPLVMRALGATVGMSGLMLGRVALAASVGMRRVSALLIGAPMLLFGVALLASPALAAIPYDKGWAILVPWMLGVPGILALMLSRWRAR
jgi:hypothetical protein